MTSFSSSFQLSPCICQHGILLAGAGERTFPLGGLVNHSVHVFMSGCLTLKFSASWNTVLTSLSESALADGFVGSPAALSEGEMGIVSSGTCWLGFGAVATSVIVCGGDVSEESE
jgi:hypothetical protein